MYIPAHFTSEQQAGIARLCQDLSKATGAAVLIDYGATDCDQWGDACLYVDSLPAGSTGHPGPLVTIIALPEGAVSVLGADGVPLAEEVGLPEALAVARLPALRSYRRMVLGALGGRRQGKAHRAGLSRRRTEKAGAQTRLAGFR